MDAENAVTIRFLKQHPAEAARILERLSPADVATFLHSIDIELAADVLRRLIPENAAPILKHIDDQLFNRFAERNPEYVARLLRQAGDRVNEQLTNRLSRKVNAAVQRQMVYPEFSVGATVKTDCPVIPASLTCEEVMKRLEKKLPDSGCLLSVIDDEHKYLGTIDLASLLSADRNATIKSHINKKTPVVNAGLSLEDILHHHAWRSYRQLPVITKDGTYLGYIDYETIHLLSEDGVIEGRIRDTFEGVISLIGLYWLSVAWILELFISGKKPRSDR